jgi:hypothetical protein
MIDRIFHDGIELAVIIRTSYFKEGIEFVTPGSYSQQLGYMCRPANYVIQPHLHNPVAREVHYTHEVLFIKAGKLRVDFYSPAREYLESKVLQGGDVILLVSGGHGFAMIEQTEIIEVKQGPYVGDSDKSRFDENLPDQLIFKE